MIGRVLAFGLFVRILLGPGISDAQFNPRGWRWKTTVTAPASSPGLVALRLDGAIYDRLLAAPDDLRLVNRSGDLVPHVIQCGRTGTTSVAVARPVDIINRTYAPKQFSRVVLDFGATVVKNKIKVDLAGENYRRRVTIEGSDDAMTWELVAGNLFLFDMRASGESYRLDTLSFPDNRFRYLRVTVENMHDDPERVEIAGAMAFYEEPAGDPQLTRVDVVKRTTDQDTRTKSTVITLDLGFRHLPLQSIALAVDNPLFQRAYAIEGRNTVKHKIYRRAEERWHAQEIDTPWNSVARGTFYRRREQGKTVEMTEATIPHGAYRYLRVTIKNNDDQPLRIREVTVNRRLCAMLFEAQPGAQYDLYGGNGRAGAPSYDLVKLISGVDIVVVPQATRGAIEPLKPDRPALPWSERYGYVITAGIAVTVAVMLWFIVPVLKREIEGKRKF